MVGNPAVRGGIDAVSNALISLLREGGQWDETDDKRNGNSVHMRKEDEDDFPLTPRGNSAVSTGRCFETHIPTILPIHVITTLTLLAREFHYSFRYVILHLYLRTTYTVQS